MCPPKIRLYKWRHVLKPGVWLLQNEAIGSVLSYLLVVTTPCYVYSITSQHDASRVKLYSWWQTVGVPLVNMWFSDFSWTYMCDMFQSQFVLRSTLTTKWKRSRSFSVVTQLWCCCWWCRFDVHRTPILDECDQLLHAIDWSVNNSCNDTPVGRTCLAPVDRMSASRRRVIVVVVVQYLSAANYCDLSPFRSLRNAPYVRPRTHFMREKWPVVWVWTAFHYNHCRLKIIHGLKAGSKLNLKIALNKIAF